MDFPLPALCVGRDSVCLLELSLSLSIFFPSLWQVGCNALPVLHSQLPYRAYPASLNAGWSNPAPPVTHCRAVCATFSAVLSISGPNTLASTALKRILHNWIPSPTQQMYLSICLNAPSPRTNLNAATDSHQPNLFLAPSCQGLSCSLG